MLDRYQKRLVPTGPLRIILLLMAAWDIIGAVVQLMFDTSLFRSTASPPGSLPGRGFSGALFVTAAVYLIARNPVRYRPTLWLGVLEQLVAVCTGIFHGARQDLKWGDEIVPVGVAIAFLMLLLLNFPRGGGVRCHRLRPREAPSDAEGATGESRRPLAPRRLREAFAALWGRL